MQKKPFLGFINILYGIKFRSGPMYALQNSNLGRDLCVLIMNTK